MPSEDQLVIDIDAVSKTYGGGVRALRDVELRVHPGEVFGLLGPNGAGKSTLVKILMTIVRPSDCKGRMFGAPIGDKAALSRVGYLPEHLRFPDYLTGEQVVDHFGAMAGVPRAARRRRSAELLETVGMLDWRDTRVGKYSKGMKQRLGVAQSLINDPDLVLLDEPTDGVDPLGRKEIRDIIARMKDNGKTVFVNSHLLSELELICERVAIMVKGEVVQQGAIEDLTEASRRYEFRVSVGENQDENALIAQAIDLNDGSIEYTPGVVRTTVSDVHAIQPMIDALRARGVTIHAIRPTRSSLEDLFMSAVKDGGGNPGGVRNKRSRKTRKGAGR
ncbi:MAG: ABC transporter ATP-binding protein [Phycisphaeraceae bacterium]|nr:ABC transporter ATP-binding protein [Phycisphaeraceae bacterium]MCB9848371.1 ABC transporter ATP-binding protein [Phycisphaeraceae bacterium]